MEHETAAGVMGKVYAVVSWGAIVPKIESDLTFRWVK